MLTDVYLPKTITVHLSKPKLDAENVTVSFDYYIKNVACSEIYETWPTEAIRANVLAQISLALNRIYTQWYRIQGYPFDITNSTYFDQAFKKGQTLQKNICDIVDETLCYYIKKRNYGEPYYAEYCDGKKVSCKGMKQWGTRDLAKRGYNAFEILKYYYGNQIHIEKIPNKQPNNSLSALPLQIGDKNDQVKTVQAFINAISLDFPNIPYLLPVDGIFGEKTKKSIQIFQEYFELESDGIIGIQTWNKLCYIFIAVRKLAQLNSIGYLKDLYSGIWQNRILKEGDDSIETQLLQYYLTCISLKYPSVPMPVIDGMFGFKTEQSVLGFQKKYGMIQDGIVGRQTWNAIYMIYTQTK